MWYNVTSEREEENPTTSESENKMNGLWRPATEEEIRDFKAVEEVVTEWSDEEFDNFIDLTGDFVWSFNKEERKKAYNKLRKYLRKYGWTAKTIENWRFTEERD